MPVPLLLIAVVLCVLACGGIPAVREVLDAAPLTFAFGAALFGTSIWVPR
jgi:hypothetical protein